MYFGIHEETPSPDKVYGVGVCSVEDDHVKNQDGQLQGWLGVLNRVGIPTPLPADHGSIGTEAETQFRSTARRLGGWDLQEPAWHCIYLFPHFFPRLVSGCRSCAVLVTAVVPCRGI